MKKKIENDDDVEKKRKTNSNPRVSEEEKRKTDLTSANKPNCYICRM